MWPTYLSYDRGTILIRSDAKVPYSTWDGRVGAFRAQALYYREILDFLEKTELSAVNDRVQDLPPCPAELKCKGVSMRPYQRKALKSWDSAGRRGVMVLPPGAGKTMIGMKAIELFNRLTIVVGANAGPSSAVEGESDKGVGIRVGVYGGGDNTIEAVTSGPESWGTGSTS